MVPLENFQQTFSEYNINPLYVFLLFIIISSLIPILQNWFVNKKIENLRNELKRSEIKFNRHVEMQIECLKTLYDKLVDFHFSFHHLTNPDYLTHSSLKININNLLEIFSSNMNYFHRNRILLPEELIAQIGIVHNKMKINKKVLREELVDLSDVEERSSSEDPQVIYGDGDIEVTSIKNRLEKLNLNESMKTTEAEIIKLRRLVENYFQQLTL